MQRHGVLVRQFVEDYHGKVEGQFVFPRLQRAGQQVALVELSLGQHRRGRERTDESIREVAGMEELLGIYALASCTPC